MRKARPIFILASFFAGFAVILGAFGAHMLENIVSPERLEIFETAVRYQMYHGLALFAVAIVLLQSGLTKRLYLVCWLWSFGILFFSGSLYVLTFADSLPGLVTSIVGPITPLGGLGLIAGWMVLVWYFYKIPH